ncbi:Glu-tRNA(Gln) amidotransferase subunit GatE [Candidatus Woesearchaeota archaeon]|jgi:Glu-tRNA(Gln) amidotransferase subunit E-like FAD-binding protein|nr:Glu-tRNA(Gln) amidotransferase subunit GatE [Candidatus Woesearchaeota archaeon]MBT4368630.1 Glu-tRNA(Gln) amidotransferase subunit GatE [Candidatus Woesearchaeota archaeon]MBT4713061.1 Glu-tRNA(Gln) amidotransferase subunit GatE [Candidatus Woesearchaeota archaeon]MBT6638983.1 Glu-tRNA(Gln) amidotransferase subunit GatE [Candidatus Woesearchaeota archaeon]MBT7134182.1 Glu-tRNA(Gln) amidotransferase subunit GatE [Candidatus Woesearchaeota archaeon]
MDYNKIGFKAGIEIHQQLEGLKLFCNCPAINSDKKPDLKAERQLRAVVGETGEVDVAAAHEMAKEKRFVYVSNSEDTCAIDYDEEPPRNANEHHLHTAIMVCKLLNADVVDELQVMRKTVVDGSNVGGFQRTMLIGKNGWIETSKGKVGIPTIFLEEEAAQKLKSPDATVKYKLDRLGIALLEITTDASLKDPEHVKETATAIGMILRSTERVKRGIGTIRQDVNVSIKKGDRVEVKGFQDLKSIPKVIAKEIERQQKLVSEDKEVKKEVRKANPDFSTTFMRPMPGGARLYPETDILPIRITKDDIEKIKLPELLTEKSLKLEKEFGISDVMAKEVLKQKIDLSKYVKKFKLKADVIANIIINVPKDIKSRLGIDSSKLNETDFMEVLEKLDKDEISKDAIEDVLVMKCEGKKVDYSKFKKADSADLEKGISEIIKEKPGLNPGAYMGLVMAKFKGQVDGKKAMEILKKLL